jgi:hypothetical protein
MNAVTSDGAGSSRAFFTQKKMMQLSAVPRMSLSSSPNLSDSLPSLLDLSRHGRDAKCMGCAGCSLPQKISSSFKSVKSAGNSTKSNKILQDGDSKKRVHHASQQ